MIQSVLICQSHTICRFSYFLLFVRPAISFIYGLVQDPSIFVYGIILFRKKHKRNGKNNNWGYYRSQTFLKLHLFRSLSSSIFLKNSSSFGMLFFTSISKDFMSATLPLMYDVVSLISPSVIVNSAFCPIYPGNTLHNRKVGEIYPCWLPSLFSNL